MLYRAPIATAPMPYFWPSSCAVDGDVVAVSYSSPGAATVELRQVQDLAVLGGVSWPSQAVSRDPLPTAPMIIALDGRRVWLMVRGNLASVDL